MRISTMFVVGCFLSGCGEASKEDSRVSNAEADTATETDTDSDTDTDTNSDSGNGDGSQCNESIEAAMQCVDGDRYLADLTFIADERVPGSDHWQAVQDLCADRFEQLGLEVERHNYGTGTNVVGTLPGAGEDLVVVLAHYDHIAGCMGADDNATGVAGVLEIARILSLQDILPYTAVLICADEEERGLIGSAAYADRAAANGDDIRVAMSFDMIGYTNDATNSQTFPDGIELLAPELYAEFEARGFVADFISAIGNESTVEAITALQTYAEANDLPIGAIAVADAVLGLDIADDLRRSDHASFWNAGYPALIISDTAELRNPNYHCWSGEDTLDTLNHDFSKQVVQMVTGASLSLLGVDP